MLIFQDMRKNAEELIRKTVEKGTAAVVALTADSQSPFTYIAEEISEVMNELSVTPLEEITICRLKDALLCLNIAAFAADTDGLRNPPYKAVFHYISETKDQLGITIEFFTNLSCDLSQESNEQSSIDLRQWGNILLFYLKGEIQKLGTHLNEQQRNALDAVCRRLSVTMQHTADPSKEDIAKLKEDIRKVYAAIMAESEVLGAYGEPLKYIADAIKEMV